MLLQPVHYLAGVIIRQPVRLWASFQDVGPHAAVRLIVRIVVSHDFQVLDGHVGKGPLWRRQRYHRARFRKADRLGQDIGSQYAPRKLPGVAPERVVKRHRPGGHFVFALRLRETADPTNGRRIAKQVGLGALLPVGPVENEEHLIAVIFRRREVLRQPVSHQFSRLCGQVPHQAFGFPVMRQDENL